MSGYTVAGLDDIQEISDGWLPCRPVRHHFGITSFGVNAWTAAAAGERVINEHDEAGDAEELYLVHRGRATFELDGERVDVPAGTFVFARPGVKRTAFAVEPGTTILAVGGKAGRGLGAGRLGAVDAGRAAVLRGQIRRGGRSQPRARGGAPPAADAPLHAGLLRAQGRPHGGGDRAAAGGARDEAHARDRGQGPHPRRYPPRAGIRGADALGRLAAREEIVRRGVQAQGLFGAAAPTRCRSLTCRRR